MVFYFRKGTKKAVTNFVTAFFMSLRKQRGNMDQRKKEPPVCANSADTGGFYTNLQIYLANLLKKQAFFFIPLLLYP